VLGEIAVLAGGRDVLHDLGRLDLAEALQLLAEAGLTLGCHGNLLGHDPVLAGFPAAAKGPLRAASARSCGAAPRRSSGATWWPPATARRPPWSARASRPRRATPVPPRRAARSAPRRGCPRRGDEQNLGRRRPPRAPRPSRTRSARPRWGGRRSRSLE